MDTRVVLALALLFTVGGLLQILGCVLWNNWWPMLTAFMYVLVPMPYLFFGSTGGSYSVVGGSDLENGWIDAGKFLTGFSAVGCIAVPAILYHAGKIVYGALIMEVAAFVVLGSAVLMYDFFSNQDSGGYW